MAFVKKTWKDRIVQYANRRLLTKSGGEVEQVTVTRDEGTISEAGDQFNASNMNNLEQRIDDGFDDVDTALSGKADSSTTYTKTQVDSLLNGKASKNLIDYYQSKSGSPAVVAGVGGYASVMVIGFAQGVGAIAILLKINNAAIASQIDMFTGAAYTGAQVTFSYNYSLSQLSIITTNASNSTFTVIKGGL